MKSLRLSIGMAQVAAALVLFGALTLTARAQESLHPGGCVLEPSLPFIPLKFSASFAGPVASSVDLTPQMPPVMNQGSLGSCCSCAIGYCLKGYMETVARGWDNTVGNHQFSPSYLYNQVNYGVDGGSYVSDNFDVIMRVGIDTMQDEPYTSDYLTWPTQAQFKNAQNFRNAAIGAASYQYVPDVASAKGLLASGAALATTLTIDNAWDYLGAGTNYVWYPNMQGQRGGHCVAIIGYDDTMTDGRGHAGAFKIQNSWGTGWGQSGRAWIAYDAFSASGGASGFFRAQTRSNFTSTIQALVSVNSPGQFIIDMGVGDTSNPAWKYTYYYAAYDKNANLAATLDLTDAAPYWPPTPGRQWWVRVTNFAGPGYNTSMAITQFAITNNVQNSNTITPLPVSINTSSYAFVDSGGPATTYSLTVNGGSGSGSYAAGTQVGIVANPAPAGQVFSQWTGATVANAGAASTTLTMPAANTTVTASYVASNSPPSIVSAAAATPNPAGIGAAVAFAVSASDPDGDPLTYTWTFGDGGTGSGSSASHAFAAAGAYTATATVSDGHGNAASSSINITVNTVPVAPIITSALTASGAIGSPFNYTLTANGSAPITFNAAPLPAGLNCSNGTISGTPSAAGITNVTLTASNSAGSDSKTLAITISSTPTAPTITSPLWATGTVGSPFSYTTTASGTTPMAYNTAHLPAGLSQSGDTISGTPTAVSSVKVTLQAINSLGVDTEYLYLTINPAPAGIPAINSAASASGTVGTAFSYSITAANSPASYNATGLPAGLAVNTSTGVIWGTPTVAGSWNVNLSATNAAGAGSAMLSLTIFAAPPPATPAITSALNAGGAVGAAFSYTITATNNPTSFSAAPLPSGLSFAAGIGKISGLPTAAGTTSVTLTAANSAGSDTRTLVITIAAGTPPSISSPLTASGNIGAAFSYTITASGTAPIAFSAAPLPAGLSFSNGTISGAPNAAGTTSVILTAANSAGSDTRTLAITISSTPTTPVITSALSATGTVGVPFSYTITANGTAPMSFDAAHLPAGLSLSGAVISGTPEVTASLRVTLRAGNNVGSDTEYLFLTINPGPGVPLAGASNTVDLGKVRVNKPFKLALPRPASLPRGVKVKWSTDNGQPLPKGVHVANGSLVGRAKTAGSISFVETIRSKSTHETVTYQLTIEP